MKARVRNTTNGYNVYVETDTDKVRIATMYFEEEAYKLRDAIINEQVDMKKLWKRISFARNGMLPRRILRIFKLHELIFAPAAYDKKEGEDEE